MIVVIADDLSGAAELAGIAFAAGLTAEVQTSFSPVASSRVICLDTAGRSLPAAAAAADSGTVYRTVMSAGPEWTFLKFDSVLRGNIASQLVATLDAGGLRRALLITANPARGRTIRGGDYFVDGVPLHLTTFANDPVHPCTTSSVRRLLGSDDPRIITPDIGSTSDLEEWARRADADSLNAGSAEFFEALLRLRATEPARKPVAPGEREAVSSPEPPLLLVCGSRASWERRVSEASDRGIAVRDIHDSLAEAAETLERTGRLLLGVGERVDGSRTPSELMDRLGEMVASICIRTPPATLMLEGGATAAGVVRRMGWSRLVCEQGIGAGVGTLRPTNSADTLVLIKPGSYPWPEEVWRCRSE